MEDAERGKNDIATTHNPHVEGKALGTCFGVFVGVKYSIPLCSLKATLIRFRRVDLAG